MTGLQGYITASDNIRAQFGGGRAVRGGYASSLLEQDLAFCSEMFACSRGGIKMRQPAAAAAVKSTADYSRRMRVHVQQAMAEGNVEAAMTSWRSKEPDMSAYRSAPVHLDEAFASLDVPELSANVRLSI